MTPPAAPHSVQPDPLATRTAPRPEWRGPALGAAVVFIALAAGALTVDVPRTGYGVKSDEATYVAQALSLAHDWDLTYERRDLERFAEAYRQGPDGIFLKRGKVLRVRGQRQFPFVRLAKRQDPNPNRLYFGKAFIYPLVAAPFVGVLGLNGMLLLNVLLLAMVAVCGYLFLAATSPPGPAAVFTSAFVGAAALPVFGVFLMPEIFNLALVFGAYFLWAYKRVRRDDRTPPQAGSTEPAWWARGWTDVAAAVLLGLATYSKPIPNAMLVAPLVLTAWWERRWWRGFALGAVAVATAALCFGLTAMVAGEFNYQGGDRKTFVGRFPFQTPDYQWDYQASGTTTDGTAAADVLTSREAPTRFVRNVKYFLVGRHFGFVPFYFPGIVAIALWALSPARRDRWRLATFLAFVASAVGLLLVLPFTWSGGGGPPGNRYLISAYPVLFFLVPGVRSAAPGLTAWTVGALFTAKMLVDPFGAAKFTWRLPESGPARLLPVELTMFQDLPVMLVPPPVRGRVLYGRDPFLLLYFLDENASPPEAEGMWVSADGRADIIVRSVDPIDYLAVDARSPIRTALTLSLGAGEIHVPLQPEVRAFVNVPAPAGIRGTSGYVYLMTASATDGFVPHTRIGNGDYRNLAAQVRFRPVPK
jgi:hypothetical protein